MTPKLTQAIPKPNYIIKLEYDNKIWKSFSLIPYLNYPIFKPLLNELFFKSLKLKHNTIVWGADEMIDIDPYTLWAESTIIDHN